MARLAGGREELRLCRVSRVRGAVVIGLVAADASCRQRRVVVVHVTVDAQAWRRSVHTGQREWRVVVVEHSIRPQHRVVTEFASRRESRRDVVHRSESIVVIRLMAAHAGGGGDVVVAVDVATRALQRWHHVRAGESETGGRVVEDRVRPQDRVVALLAGLGETGLHVVRIVRSLIVLQVTTHTCSRGDAVVAVDVAAGALQRRHGMRATQSEACGRMVEDRIGPQNCVVALLASLGEAGSHVVGVRSPLEIFQVATHARRRSEVVIVVDVAIGALSRGHRVHSGQGKAGAGVVEGRSEPRRSVVALLAGLREIRRHVVRIRRPLVILQVTRHAGRIRDVVIVVGVAVSALSRRHGVHSRQREGRLRVIEHRRLPGRGGMADLTSLGDLSLGVIRIARSLVILQVTRHASGTGEVVIVIGVTIGALAWRRHMRSGQREVHQRVIEGRRLPGDRGVALLASLGEVSRDVIGVRGPLKIFQVARYAGGAGQVVVVVDVAIHALSGRHGVSSRQGESHRRVIELGVQPVIESVTGFAGRRELAGDVIRVGSLLVILGVA